MQPPGSIAARLFFLAVILSFTILLIAGIVLSTLYQKNEEMSFDERLGVYLRALIVDLATPPSQSDTEERQNDPDKLGDPQFDLALSGWYWQITRLDGAEPQIRTSRSLFAAKLPKLADLGVPAGIGGARHGYAIGPDERRLRIVERIIDAGDQGIYLVQIAATTEELDQHIFSFELALSVTFLLLALALIGSTWLQLRYGLRPLRDLREGVVAIRRGEKERIEGSFPSDLAPLADELNLMIASNREVVERARTQVGNLAHALKTPLSVIVNEADGEQTNFAAKVREQALLMRDHVTYYLNRARAAVRAGTLGSATPIEPVVAAMQRTFGKIYRDRNLTFETDVPTSLKFKGEKQDLEEMIGNLVDNAQKWAVSTVTLRAEGELTNEDRKFLRITIDDDGPGLAAELRAEAIKRGRRLDETKPGSGLGLSIVTDLAALYGGALTLDVSPARGLRAQLRLPAA
nr:HAMP domain-containing sensor histidine kinase [Beijerinckia indica]